MFNPAHFFGPKPVQAVNNRPRAALPIVIDKLQEDSKSKWDEPIMIPSILYSKFNVPVPKGEQNKQGKQYPNSLVDYIKRAYDRCKDEEQRKIMEVELRKIINNFQDDLNQISWKTYPLPLIYSSANQVKHSEAVTPQVISFKKGQITLPASYKIVEEDKPSKARLIAQKRLEKLEKKLNHEVEPKDKEEDKKFFIGFKNTPEPQPLPPTHIKMPESNSYSRISSKADGVNKVGSEQKNKSNQQVSIKQKSTASSKSAAKKTESNLKINKKQLKMISESKEPSEGLKKVVKRFAEFNRLPTQKYQNDVVGEEDDEQNYNEKIVGKSQSIEKPYLRITGRPNPDTVRPEPVLEKALEYFTEKYRKGCDYEYLISQFRSIRQDLTVQHIKNSLTVHVYQQNLKISLFEGDIAQFKHCQTTLWQLYSQGLYYTKESRVKYISYQMMTLIMENKFQDMQFMLTQLPQENILETIEIQDCLRLERIMIVGNYRGFFDFYAKRDNFGRKLLNQYIDMVRVKCLIMVCRTFGEKVSLESLAQLIGEDEDILETIIIEEGGVLQNGYLMLKPSYEKFIKSERLASRKVTILLA